MLYLSDNALQQQVDTFTNLLVAFTSDGRRSNRIHELFKLSQVL